MRLIIALAVASAVLSAGCGKTAKEEPAPQRAAAPESPAAQAPEGQPAPLEEEPAPVITSVRLRWIISDSVPKVEIMLIGQNLPAGASVVSNSPQVTIEKIEPDTFMTTVQASLAAGTPPGDYELQYLAPGRPPIPFKIHYQAPPN